MSAGIKILRTFRNFYISNTLKYSSSRVTSSLYQLPNRSFCAESAAAEVDNEKTAKEPDPKDRSVKIPVETSIRYLKSRAYAATYGDQPVWVPYRRNFKGHYAPPKTRKTCIRNDRLATGNPCPICRDEYLVLDYTNVDLLKQFISPYTGEILDVSQTNLCQRQHDNLMVSILKAQEAGLLTHDVPFRRYNYSQYDPNYVKERKDEQ